MRILMTGIALTAAMMLMSGCASVPENHALHAYPQFGTLAGGGRYVIFQRQTTGNLLPASSSAFAKRSTPARTLIR
jgi:hypothetical protein